MKHGHRISSMKIVVFIHVKFLEGLSMNGYLRESLVIEHNQILAVKK